MRRLFACFRSLLLDLLGLSVSLHELIHDVLQRDVLLSRILKGSRADNTTVSLGSDHVCYISDALVIELKVSEIRLADVERDSEQLQNGILFFTCGQRSHRRIHEVKLLLQVVEADRGIDTVPIQGSRLICIGRHKSTIEVLLVENVEKGLVELWKSVQTRSLALI